MTQGPATSPPRGPRAPGGATSLERVAWIVALDADPVRRNLFITQCYHDLSAALAKRLGAENANWCTFATWASRTAGRFIRDEEVPEAFRRLLEISPRIDEGLARANAAVTRIKPEAAIPRHRVLGVSRRIVEEVGELITAGNLAVFSELGPLFSRTIAALDQAEDGSAVAQVAASLAPGQSERGGQTLLRQALAGYAAAREADDPRRKAALVLLANARVGLHEQIRLQPYIAGSIDAPVQAALFEPVDEAAACLPRGLQTLFRGALRLAVLRAANDAKRRWQELATRELMTLELPGETLVLGRDLPAPKGQPLYPPVLDPVEEAETLAFLRRHGADRPAATGTAADNWTRLEDRMRYIIDLFRSRQVDAKLQAPPFTSAQRRELLSGLPVSGRL